MICWLFFIQKTMNIRGLERHRDSLAPSLFRHNMSELNAWPGSSPDGATKSCKHLQLFCLIIIKFLKTVEIKNKTTGNRIILAFN